jgi:hypothetical protein
MVDALSRACRWVKRPDGRIVDLRPTDVQAAVEIGLQGGRVLDVGGLVVDDERHKRHAAADAAVRTTVDRGLVRIESEQTFPFYRYADSAEELRDYIAAKWQHTRMDAATRERAADMLRAQPGGRLWLREQVGIRVLVPRVNMPS